MHPAQQAQNLAADLSDVILDVHARASRRGYHHLLLVFDRDDPTALELLTEYASPSVQLARARQDDAEVVALTMSEGLKLLRAPKHEPTIFHRVADEIEADKSGNTLGIAIARGGFVRFAVAGRKLLH